MNSGREYNYEWLRIISMIAVIMIHVSATWFDGFSEYVAIGGSTGELLHPVIACIYNTISRFAVPCFIMLTGAFVLADSRTANYCEFYRKKLRNIGIPTIVFSIFYIIYRIPFVFIGKQGLYSNIITFIMDIVKGSPFYHMWYLYMLVGIYLFAPIVIRFKDSISYNNFRIIAFVFLIWASFSRWTTENVRLNWDIGQSFEYLGYFMVGYILRRDLRKSNSRGSVLISLGVLCLFFTAFARYNLFFGDDIVQGEFVNKLVSPYCPTMVMASVLIFAGFTMLEIGCNHTIKKLADLSFMIYLFHAGVWDFFYNIIYLIMGKDYIIGLNNIYCIPFFVVVVLLISILLTIVYRKIECVAIKSKVNVI